MLEFTEITMLKTSLVMSLFFWFFFFCIQPVMLFAGKGDKVILAHPVTVYPGSIREVATERTIWLTKDKFADVKKYYETKKDPGDRLEPFRKENETGINLVLHKTINGQNQSVLEAQVSSRTPDSNFHKALRELQAQAAMGKHSQAEYQQLEEKYKDLHLAYFRQIEDADGRMISEGEVIYRKAWKEAHPKTKSTDSAAEHTEGKARAQEQKRQMQELKTKGDIAETMQLAQQSNKSPSQTSADAAAMSAMNRDTWDLWVKCLEDVNRAAFWTRLYFNSNALGQ